MLPASKAHLASPMASYDPEKFVLSLLSPGRGERINPTGDSYSSYELHRENAPRTYITTGSPEKEYAVAHVEKYGGDSSTCLPLRYLPTGCESPSKVLGDAYLALDGDIPEDLQNYLFERGVHVEQVVLKYPSAYCFIRVLNIAHTKRVFVRFTCDGWATHHDVEASQVAHDAGSEAVESTAGTNQFCAVLRVPPGCTAVEFAVCYQVDGREYWDNCDTKNYRVRVCALPKSGPGSPSRRVISMPHNMP